MKTFEHLVEVVVLTALLCAVPLIALSLPEPVKTSFPTLQHVGDGKYKAFFIKVYNIHYYQSEKATGAEALHIGYYMDLKAKKRLDRAVKDIKAQNIADAPLADWEGQMKEIFPDVKDGDSITIVKNKLGHSSFYHNDTPRGTITDPIFTRAFFNIWLGEETGLKSLKEKLLKNALHK